VKERIASKRKEREEREKQEQLEKEKQRRLVGKDLTQAKWE